MAKANHIIYVVISVGTRTILVFILLYVLLHFVFRWIRMQNASLVCTWIFEFDHTMHTRFDWLTFSMPFAWYTAWIYSVWFSIPSDNQQQQMAKLEETLTHTHINVDSMVQFNIKFIKRNSINTFPFEGSIQYFISYNCTQNTLFECSFCCCCWNIFVFYTQNRSVICKCSLTLHTLQHPNAIQFRQSISTHFSIRTHQKGNK